MKKTFKQFLRYAAVGTLGTGVDLGSLYVLVEWVGTSVLLGSGFAFVIAVISNFALNKIWTFESKSNNNRKLFSKFMLVSIVGLGLTLGLMVFLVELIMMWYILAKLITSGAVVGWNFFANKHWTFQLKKKKINLPPVFKKDVSVVIPAYNEERRLEDRIHQIHSFFKSHHLSFEILVVDDGSSDGTGNLVRYFSKRFPEVELISYAKNKGKGYAVGKGVDKARGRYILFMDADLATPLEAFDDLLLKLKDSHKDIAISTRFHPNSSITIEQSQLRILIGQLGRQLTHWVLGQAYSDTQCGFKLFKAEAAKRIFALQRVHRFAFDMELLLIAHHLNYQVCEVPVMWAHQEESRVRPVRDAMIALKDLFYMKGNAVMGQYSSEECEMT